MRPNLLSRPRLIILDMSLDGALTRIATKDAYGKLYAG